ncbi:MAG: acyltransferase, partial [Pseudolabrys sp.]
MSVTYRSDIDGLRGVAVLSVIGFHAFPNYVPGGFVGVDIFFVISGFLISSVIFDGQEKGNFSFADFYARRIRRIFPALIIVLATCTVFGWYILTPTDYALLGKSIAASAAFVYNFALLQEQGYFDLASELKPLLHLWSLGV